MGCSKTCMAGVPLWLSGFRVLKRTLHDTVISQGAALAHYPLPTKQCRVLPHAVRVVL